MRNCRGVVRRGCRPLLAVLFVLPISSRPVGAYCLFNHAKYYRLADKVTSIMGEISGMSGEPDVDIGLIAHADAQSLTPESRSCLNRSRLDRRLGPIIICARRLLPATTIDMEKIRRTIGAALNSARAMWRLAIFLVGVFGFSSAIDASERWAGLAEGIFHQLAGSGAPAGIRAIVEDEEGFLWFGTESGMVRWDGYHFRTYTVQPGVSLIVRTLHIDSRGRLWVGTQMGLIRYERRQDKFIAYAGGSDNQKKANVRSISDDGNGGLWIGTDDGLEHLVDSDSERFVRPGRDSALPDSLANHRVNTVIRDSAGTVWVGGRGGLVRLQKGAARFEPIPFAQAGGRLPEVSYLFEDSTGRLWAGTAGDGAFVMALQDDHATHFDAHDSAGISSGSDWVWSIEESRPGEIWMGTTDGIVAIHPASGESRRIRRDSLSNTSLPSDTVWATYKDHSGLIWGGTPQGGAWRNGQTAALTLFGGFGRAALDAGDVYAVLQTEDRSVWLGSPRGIQIIDPTATKSRRLAVQTGAAAKALANAHVFTLAAGQNGQVYAGTQHGVYRVDARTEQVSAVAIAPEGQTPKILTLYAEKDQLWIGSDSGELWQLDFATGRVEKILSRDDKEQLFATTIAAIQRGPDGWLWIGTAPGLNRVDPIKHVVEHVLADSLDSNVVFSTFLTDRKGRLWLGTFGGGIQRLEGRDAQGRFRFRSIGISDGLPNANIDKLLEAPDGHIWASTDDGIAVIDPDTFAVRALHKADDIAIPIYWLGSGSATREGELLFGGAGGLTVLRPDRLTDWSLRAPVVISDIKIDGKTATGRQPNGPEPLAPLVIQPEATSFAVEFSALDFSAPDRNRYSYRLEGFDRSWIETDADHRIAAYTNLAPGDYMLRMRGTNRNGTWTEPALALPIHVVAAWYQTWWFRLGSGLLIALVVTSVYRYRVRKLFARQKLMEELVQKNQDKSKFVANAAHDLRQPMQAIGNLLEAAQHAIASEDIVKCRSLVNIAQMAAQAMRSSFDSVLEISRLESGLIAAEYSSFDVKEMMDEIMLLLKPLADERGVRIRTKIAKGKQLFVHSDQHLLSRAVYNLLSNAIRYSDPAKKNATVIVAVVSLPNKCRIDILDNGIGIPDSERANIFKPYFQIHNPERDREKGLGLGLSIVNAIMLLLPDHRIRMRSVERSGSRFSIELPKAAAPVTAQIKNHIADASLLHDVAGIYVLFVEDDMLVRISTEALFREYGILYESLKSFDELSAKLASLERMPDLVLTDFTLSKSHNAIDVVNAVTAEFGRPIPTIVLTGESEHRVSVQQLGSAVILRKPLSAVELLNEIRRMCPSREIALSHMSSE